MAEQRCPMCGKTNPEEAENCIHCQAKLLPVHGESASMIAGEENPVAAPQDWLRDLLSKSEADQAADTPPEQEAAEPLPDAYILPGEETIPTEAAGEGDDLDRLESLMPGFDKSVEQKSTPPAIEPLLPDELDDTPAWLRPLQGETTGSESAPPGETGSESSESEDSGWRPLADRVPRQQPAGITDWLKALERKTRLEEEEGPPPDGEEPTGESPPEEATPGVDLPGWLKESEAEAADELQVSIDAIGGAEPGILEPPEEDIPGWMRILDQPLEQVETSVTEAPIETLPETEAANEGEILAGETLTPVVEGIPGLIDEGVESTIPSQIDSETLDWLSSLSAEDLQAPDIEAIPPEGITEEEVPTEEELENLVPTVEEAEGEASEPAEDQAVPGEGSAVVPVDELAAGIESLEGEEKAQPAEEEPAREAVVEAIGPLSGLPLIPVESISLQYRKPPAYSSRLKVSDKERASAELLENMVNGERSARPGKPISSRLPQRLARLASGILLIAVLLVPLLTGTSNTATPAPEPASGAGEMYASIESLPANSTVLLAADFQPGYAGELGYAAGAVLEHLMRKQASLVIVSTTPGGPVLAGNLVQNALNNLNKSDPAAVQSYQAPGSIINLGFLAGGLASIQEFTRQPRQASLYGFSSSANLPSPWESPGLQGIEDLKDFAAVVVICDSDDSGRAWIEQAQPALAGQGLLLISSAQAGPMLSPYLYSGQLAGLVAGLPGGMAYQADADPQASSTIAPVSFRYGMLTGAIFLVAGLFLAILTSLFSHKGQGEMRGR